LFLSVTMNQSSPRDESDLKFVLRFSDHIDSTEFTSKFENFIKDNCHVIDLDTSEHSHEYYELYQDYTVLIEDMLESFLEKEQLDSPSELYRKLRDASNENDCVDDYLQYVIAAAEYESFAKVMRQHWKEFAEEHNLLSQESESKHK